MAKATAKKSNVVDLGKFKDAAEDLYESYQIRVDGEVVRLYNPIRIAPESRERVFELASAFSFPEDHKFEPEDLKRIHPAVLEILELVGDDNVFRLIESIRNDLVVAINVFTDYFQTVNLGEASSSES
jgi:tail assembly protein